MSNWLLARQTKLGTILVVDACGARQNSHNEQSFPWAHGHLNPNISFVDHLTPQALPIRRSYFVNFVHSVQQILSLIALGRLRFDNAQWPSGSPLLCARFPRIPRADRSRRRYPPPHGSAVHPHP